VKLLYFAWVRERIGRAEESCDPPAEVTTAAELVEWLRGRGPEYANALDEPATVRIAIDRVHARGDTPLAGAREVAIFPPMTGG